MANHPVWKDAQDWVKWIVQEHLFRYLKDNPLNAGESYSIFPGYLIKQEKNGRLSHITCGVDGDFIEESYEKYMRRTGRIRASPQS